MKPVLIVGAGWSGAVVAHILAAAGVPVEVLERGRTLGGHSRVEQLCGVVYEPNGPHILHTDKPKVARFFAELGLAERPYSFQPKTEIVLADGTPRIMSWPIQVAELEDLPDWPTIKAQLADLPPEPKGDDFETYAVSLMGPRLYELYIEGYTRKQWGCEPSELSSSFAPKRIDIRDDGDRRLFRDAWQYFPPEGVNSAIEQLLAPVMVTCGADVTAADLATEDVAAVVITAALDDFAGMPDLLPWRGVHLRSTYYPLEPHEGHKRRTEAYVINRPSMSVPYTRTIETKHATDQYVSGTVVSTEYPGATAKHYPVADLYGRNAALNAYLQGEVRSMISAPTFFCGRLATYKYINQDEAIENARTCAEQVFAQCV